jgi:hypothetical protein
LIDEEHVLRHDRHQLHMGVDFGLHIQGHQGSHPHSGTGGLLPLGVHWRDGPVASWPGRGSPIW